MNGVNQVNRINIFVYQVVKYFPFRKSVMMNLFIETSSVEVTYEYDHYKLMDKYSQFNLYSFNYLDCSPHNFGNDIEPK